MPRWSVDLIRKRLKRLGTVMAANEADAIKKRWRFFVALGHAFQADVAGVVGTSRNSACYGLADWLC